MNSNKKIRARVVLTKSAGSHNGDVVPGEAGGDPHGDDLHVRPAVPLLHQHAARPNLPLDLAAADAAGIAIAAAAGTGSAALGGGAPPEQLLGVPQLDHLRNRAQP